MSKAKTNRAPYKNLFRDLFFIGVSVFVSVWIVRLGILQNVVNVVAETRLLAAFITGFFFTSAFTIAPAAVILAGLGQHASHFQLALWGACGALVGDLTIFFFVKDRFADDILDVLKITKARKITHFFKKGFFRWLSPLIGAIIIASPLPDEIGITMMGISKTRLTLLIPISFIMNFIGVYVVVSAFGAF
jgi:hypothetical protein